MVAKSKDSWETQSRSAAHDYLSLTLGKDLNRTGCRNTAFGPPQCGISTLYKSCYLLALLYDLIVQWLEYLTTKVDESSNLS